MNGDGHASGDALVACNLCGSERFRPRYPDTRPNASSGKDWEAFRCTHGGYGVHGPIVECLDCGLIYANPRPTTETIGANYENVEDPVYEKEKEARRLTFRSHLEDLERVVGEAGGRRLLDVGAHIGVFVEEACRNGWQAQGIEPSKWAVESAKGRGIDLTQGFLEDRPFKDQTFDVITLWDVIEHLTDPAAELELCNELVEPGGWIAIHTMDAGSLAARILGRRWPWLMEMHLYYFDRKSLGELLQRTGFEPVRTEARSRYLSLGYLAGRLHAFSPILGAPFRGFVRIFRLGSIPVPVTFGDLITCYARKK